MNLAKDERKTRQIYWLKIALVVLSTLAVALVPSTESYTPQMRMFFIIVTAAVMLWVTEIMNIIIVALMLPVLFLLFNVAQANVIFGPWGTHLPYLVLGALIISVVADQAGVMRRLAYFFIVKSGGSYTGILIAMTTAGFFISFLIPGSLARVALFCGIALGVCAAMDFKPFSKPMLGMLFGAYNAAVTTSFVVITGTEPVIVMNEQIKAIGMEPLSYFEYIKHNLVINIIWSYLLVFIIIWLFRPKDTGAHMLGYFKEKQRELGSISKQEIKVALYLGVLVLLLATQTVHRIDLGWIFILMACFAFFPGVNLANPETLQRTNFGMIFFICATMAIGSVANSTGAGKFVADALFPLMGLAGGGSLGASYTVVATWVFSVIINILLTPFAAGSAFAIPLAELAKALEINVFPLLYSFNYGLYQFFFPYESTLPLLLYSYGVMKFAQFLRFFAIQMFFNLLFLALIAIPFWYLIGII